MRRSIVTKPSRNVIMRSTL